MTEFAALITVVEKLDIFPKNRISLVKITIWVKKKKNEEAAKRERQRLSFQNLICVDDLLAYFYGYNSYHGSTSQQNYDPDFANV